MTNNVLEMENITKVYGNGIMANNGVNFSLKEREIHALMGENGAGKSTLMNILFGFERQDEGTIKIDGKEVTINNSSEALELGIGMIHQHFKLVPSFTVMENIILGHEPKKGLFTDTNKSKEIVNELVSKYNFSIDVNERVRDLPIGKQQQVEILKALYRGAKILILDEPTAVLAPQETELLFKQLKILRDQGHTLIFISHKIPEVIELCDRISILRSGKSVGVYDVHTSTGDGASSLSESEITSLMIGRDIVLEIEKKPANIGETVLDVSGITQVDKFNKVRLNNVSFKLREGEILGIAGVEGNGQSQLVELITKIENLDIGDIRIDNKSIKDIPIKNLRDEYISYIPSDRIAQGVSVDMNIKDNVIPFLVDTDKYSKYGVLDNKGLIEVSEKLIDEYHVKAENSSQLVGMLSGGNIQKVVVSREISGITKKDVPLVIAEQPSRGIDIGSTKFIHNELIKIRDRSKAVLLISADLNELLELADSIIVLFNGEITAYFPDATQISEQELGKYMLGLDRQPDSMIGEILND